MSGLSGQTPAQRRGAFGSPVAVAPVTVLPARSFRSSSAAPKPRAAPTLAMTHSCLLNGGMGPGGEGAA